MLKLKTTKISPITGEQPTQKLLSLIAMCDIQTQFDPYVIQNPFNLRRSASRHR